MLFFAYQNNTHRPAQLVQPHQDEQRHACGKDVVELIELAEEVEDEHMKCLQKLAETGCGTSRWLDMDGK